MCCHVQPAIDEDIEVSLCAEAKKVAEIDKLPLTGKAKKDPSSALYGAQKNKTCFMSRRTLART